ncbi:MAG: HEAT repeat domain-containing protein [Chthonomonadales bacterium]
MARTRTDRKAELVRRLGDPNPAVRRTAVGALGSARGRAACGALLAALDDEAKEVRSAAALALGKRSCSEAAEPLAARLRHDPSPHVCMMCLAALWLLCGCSALDRYVAALGDGDERVIWAACEILGQ